MWGDNMRVRQTGEIVVLQSLKEGDYFIDVRGDLWTHQGPDKFGRISARRSCHNDERSLDIPQYAIFDCRARVGRCENPLYGEFGEPMYKDDI
jgi:hypothetical protein